VLLPLAGAAVIGFVLIEMDRSAKILGAAWIAIGVAYYWVQAGSAQHDPRKVE
jgi:hypothetical protein